MLSFIKTILEIEKRIIVDYKDSCGYVFFHRPFSISKQAHWKSNKVICFFICVMLLLVFRSSAISADPSYTYGI
ncbi:MAG: hypothetical protein MUP22_03035, partial [Desulfobacterales bacterium]|nr:hypothetical protein [Desulfobacterales bacterium]